MFTVLGPYYYVHLHIFLRKSSEQFFIAVKWDTHATPLWRGLSRGLISQSELRTNTEFDSVDVFFSTRRFWGNRIFTDTRTKLGIPSVSIELD